MIARVLLPCVALLALAWLQDERAPDPLSAERDLATLVPESALFYAEAPALSAVLAQGLDHPLAKALLASELGAVLAQATGRPPRELLAVLDETAGLAVLPTLSAVGERGFALASMYGEKKPNWLLFARGSDAAKQRELVARVLEVVAKKAGFPGAFEEPGDEISGADVWYVGPELKVALRDSLAIASNDGKLLRAALDLAAHADARGLAGSEEFACVTGERDAKRLLWAWADLDGLAAGEPGDGVKKLREMVRDPGAQFLLGPGLSAIGSGSAMTLSVDLEREDLRVSLRGLGLELGAAKALMPSSGTHSVEIGANSHNVVDARVYRDAAAVFEHRLELFAPEKLPGFAKASSDLALFFGGRDFSESILPHVSPWVRVVARPVTFDPKATPEIPLPAAAALLAIDTPDELGPVLVSAFQTAIGLVNVDRAQKGLDSLLMKLELVDGVQMTSARFIPPREGDGVDLRYNLEPACAMVGAAFVVGTHSALVAELVRDLNRPKGGIVVPGEIASVKGRAVADIVRANFDALAAQAVLDEGKTREKAEGDLRGLIGLLDLVQDANVRVRYPSATEVRVDVQLDLVAASD